MAKVQLGSLVPYDMPLMEAGLDSLGAIELRTALSTHYQLDLPATLMFDHPTVAALASHITTLLEGQQPPLQQVILSPRIYDCNFVGDCQVPSRHASQRQTKSLIYCLSILCLLIHAIYLQA